MKNFNVISPRSPFKEIVLQPILNPEMKEKTLESDEKCIETQDLRKPKKPLYKLHKKKTALHVHTNSINLDSVKKSGRIKKLLTCKEKRSIVLDQEVDENINLRVFDQTT